MNSLQDYFVEKGVKKLIIITAMYPPFPKDVIQLWGGIEIELETLVQTLRDKNISVSIISFDYIHPISHSDAAIYRLGIYSPYVLRPGILTSLSFAYKEFFRPLLAIRIFNILRQEKPDCVLVGKSYQLSLGIFLACLILHIPYYVRYDWCCPSYPKKEPCKLLDRMNCSDCIETTLNASIPIIFKKSAIGYFLPLFVLKRYFWNKSQKVFAVSQFFFEVYEAFGIHRNKIEIIPPISTIQIDPQRTIVLKEKYKKNNSFIVLFVGRLEPEKGINVLIDAMNHPILKNENITLLIAGTGRLAPFVEDSSKIDPRIIYLGLIPHHEVGNYYTLADLIAIPSIVPESYGLVADEALSIGKSIIGFNIGGLREFQNRYKNVHLVDCGIEPFAEGIKQLLKNKII